MKSYKHKIYTTLGTPTSVDTELVPFKDYVGDSTGVPVKNYTVRGKSIVWNQLIQNGNFQDDSNWYREGGDYIVDSNLLTFTTDGSILNPNIYQNINKSNFIEGHYYYACVTVIPSNYSDATIAFALHNGSDFQQVITSTTATSGSKYLFEAVFTLESDFFRDITDSARIIVYAPQDNASQEYITFISNIMLIDLTKMFGSGYEPQTPAQFRSMFSEDYYGYDEGTLKSVEPTQLQSSSVERYQIADFGTLYGKGENLSFSAVFPSDTKIIKGHIYLLHGDTTGDPGTYDLFYNGNNTNEIFITISKNRSYAIGTSKYTVKGGSLNAPGYFWIYGHRCESATNIMFIDLTELFGAGNEPQTVEDFQSYFPNSYYKSNPSAYKAVNIPSSKYFPDGMRSAGSAYDEINFLSQKAIKRIDVRVYQAGDENDVNVTTDLKNTNYALATPVETAVVPSLQALPTYKEFNSFSAPNTLTQTGPFSIEYYSTSSSNPENGWLTSYKRKLYMGRNIEWNQLFTNSKTFSDGVTISQNSDGTITLNGVANRAYINFTELSDAMNQAHKYLLCLKILNNPDNVSFYYGWLNRYKMYTDTISNGESCNVCNQSESLTQLERSSGLSGLVVGTVLNNVKIAVMVMDLTQMFGAGNEPATSAEFWSYFDHKYYPYNTGETQLLFKISRKSWRGSVAHKGDLIDIEGKQYRVLKTNGNIAEVLAMYDAGESAYGSTQVYSGSTMDTYCNETFYGTLSTNLKNAIVDKKFQQDRWYAGGLGNPVYCGTYQSTNNYQIGLDTTTFGEEIIRKCYILSVQDVIDYLNVEPSMNYSNTTLISENIWKMFWNKTVHPDDNVWYAFRTCYAADKLYNIFYANSFYGNIEDNNINGYSTVRPAFKIDLSKISWSLVEVG